MPHVLMICTGNICRSPVAAQLLQGYLGNGVKVTSAGTRAVIGADIEPKMAAAVRELDLSAQAPVKLLEPHAAVQLSPALLETADLVVGMTTAHRDAAVALAPACMPRAVTLDELALTISLIAPSPTAVSYGGSFDNLPGFAVSYGGSSATDGGTLAPRIKALADAVAEHRHHLARHGTTDIPDPYGRRTRDYETAARMIDERVGAIAAWLTAT